MHPLAKLRALAWLSRPSVPGKGAGRTTSLAGFFEGAGRTSSLAGFFEGAGFANSDARRYISLAPAPCQVGECIFHLGIVDVLKGIVRSLDVGAAPHGRFGECSQLAGRACGAISIGTGSVSALGLGDEEAGGGCVEG